MIYSQSEMIVRLLESKPKKWFMSYELTQVWTPFGWIGSEGKRRCRELVEAGLIIKEREGKYVKYHIAV